MTKKKTRLNYKYALLAAIAGVIIIIVLLELTNTTHFFHKQNVPPVIPTQSNSTNSANPASTINNGSNGKSSPAASNEPDASAHTLVSPTGNFVSNHYPGQSGAPTTETSTCNTSPQASCYIKFTNVNSGDTTQLPTQVTDARGSTSWYWDTKNDAHLTSGQWKIIAVATLGDQTKTADDALKLTIQ
jgi:hypothetical protein